MAAHPVPALEIVGVVNANLDFELGLSPKTGAVRWKQSHARIELCPLELAIAAKEIDSRLIVVVFAKIVVGLKLEAYFVRAGHLIAGVELEPISTNADAILLALIGRHSATLSECQRGPTD